MTESEVFLIATVREAAKSGETERTRKRAHLSRSEVAAVCGVDQSTVARWERGQRSPRGAAGLKYARLLNRLRQVSAQQGEAS